jgi:hypothetical protein
VNGADGWLTSSSAISAAIETGTRSFSVLYGSFALSAPLIVWLGVVSSSV